MKILFAGKYNPDYNRTKIILNGLKKLPDVEVFELPFPKKKKFPAQEFEKIKDKIDVVFCPSFSHKTVRFLKKKTGKPIVFDPLISNYLTKVYDYKNVLPWSPRAYRNYLKDKLPFKAADVLITDTLEHNNYFHKTFGIEKSKMEVLYIGADTEEFNPKKNESDPNQFIVGFYGGFIPLQGVQKIIEAAELLKEETDIVFKLIGTGFQYEEMKALVKEKGLNNIVFEGWIEATEIPFHLKSYDVCLGIFGDTPKAQLVIPNKIYHYAAMGKPIITMETEAIKELFENGNSIIHTNNSPASIKEAILDLRSNSSKRELIGANGGKMLQEEYNEVKVAERLVEIIERHLLK